MDRIKKLILEEKKHLKNIDIRRYDFYLSEEQQKAWSDHESDPLYNTLWFEAFINGPDIEYSETVVYVQSHLPFFKEKLKKGKWETVYHSKGKIIRPKNNKTFTADLMTGWWNPFADIFEIPDRKEFGKEIRASKDFSKWYEGFKERNNEKFKDEKFIKVLNKFLKVVYTIGNTIPAPINKFYANKLDAWDAKLSVIKDSFKENKLTELAWNHYIYSCYGGTSSDKKFTNENFNIFIEKNYLKMYLDQQGEIKSFWTDKNNQEQHIPPTLDDWKTYFNNAAERVEERNYAIEKELLKVMNNA